MPADQSARESAEQLSQAKAEIARLRAENARLLQDLAASRSSIVAQPGSWILESITDAFVAIDRQFRYIWVNAEAERCTGMARDQLLGRCMWDLFPDAVGTTLEIRCRQAMAEQVPLEFESYYAPLGRWFLNKAYPTREGGLSIYWRDITAEKSLESEFLRHSVVLRQVHDAIITTDLDGTITQWNHGAVKLFGYSSEEVVGQSVSLLYFEEDREHVRAAVLDPLLRAGHSEVEMRNQRKSGEECFVRLSLSLLRDEAGHPYAMLGVSTDVTPQKRAEQALRESERRYRSLADAMPQVAYIAGPDGKTEMINRHWEKFSGISAAECLDLNWMSWVHPADSGRLGAVWMACVSTGTPFEMEYRLRNAAGGYAWHLSRAVPVTGSDGKIIHWVGTVTDIDQQKQIEDALRKSEERFRLASQAVEGVVYDWDPGTDMVHRSGSLEGILGINIEQAEPTAKWWQERVHPEDIGRTALNLLASLHGRNNFETEYRMRNAAGQWVDVCNRGYIVRDEEGRPVRVVGSAYNISQRKQLEREVAENNRRLKFQADLLATTNDAIIAINSEQVVTYCNAGVGRMYGVAHQEFIGKPLAAILRYRWLHPGDEERTMAELARHDSWKGENVHVRGDGTELIVSSTVNILPPHSGGGMVAVIRDITDQRRAEQAGIQHAADLARANEDLLHFAYAVSHDLQAPLRTVTSFSQLLAQRHADQLGRQGCELVAFIADASSRMSSMIRDLLTFARVAGSERQAPETSLEASLEAAIANLSTAIEESAAVITYDPLPTISGDPHQLVQLLQNLIGNSIQYAGPATPPRIHLSAAQSGRSWVIHVRDNGMGFQPAYAERIFRVFQRLNDDSSGTGMGLAICKRIVERMGGRIWAVGEPGQGAVFSFSVPIHPAGSRS